MRGRETGRMKGWKEKGEGVGLWGKGEDEDEGERMTLRARVTEGRRGE